jgi:hypothetical protein
MALHLTEIERVKTISKADFYTKYVKKQKPVVVEQLTSDWPAYSKWHLNYIKTIAGDKIVPLYDDRPVSHKDGFNEAHAKMKMADYVDLLLSKPTNYRIFLYNLMKEVPSLKNDFKWPALTLAKGFVCDLNHGEMLYMPEGYWHYMKYVTPGFSMSLRAIARNPVNLSKAVYNIVIMRYFDNIMRRIQGQKWIEWKNAQAIVRTQKVMNS